MKKTERRHWLSIVMWLVAVVVSVVVGALIMLQGRVTDVENDMRDHLFRHHDE